MRDHEAVIVKGRQYRLPSTSVVEVEELYADRALCRYVALGHRISHTELGAEVPLTMRFLEKFAQRVRA